MSGNDKAVRIGHEMIMASAGSGKTRQLTNRILKLLALGVPPERINALTFTKKAAGEFFDTVLARLAEAAESDERARALGREIEVPSLTQDEILSLLGRLVGRLHLLSFGTLDSFFHRVVRNFPFEFGLSGEPEILDDNALNVEQRRAFQQLFQGFPLKKQAYRDFFEAFKQATWGTEERRLVGLLDRFVREGHAIYLMAPHREQWGDSGRIWPQGCPWLGQASFPKGEVDALETLVQEKEDLTSGQQARWLGLIEAVRQWQPGVPFSKPIQYFLERGLPQWDAIRRREATLLNDKRKEPLTPDQCRCFERVLTYLMGGAVQASLRRTRGLFELLRHYDDTYSRLVRRQGKLTFHDVLVLLNGVFAPEGSDVALGLSQSDPHHGLAIQFRLDSQYDHWLLDEFQDTSFPQWRIIQPLIDEVVQDAEGKRSFFYVGDVKQSIFGWRGGDPRLFQEVFQYYNQGGNSQAIEARRLDQSWRSGRAIIETVNQVFGDDAVFTELFPEDTARRWRSVWGNHVSRRPELTSYAGYFQTEDETHRHDLVVGLLEAIQPVEKGFSCAILVQRNKTAEALIQHVRERSEIPVTSESDVWIGRDNPLSIALLSLLKAAAHPKDRYAWEHVKMTPFGACVRKDGLDQETFVRRVLAQVHRDGFEGTVEAWIERFWEECSFDAFTEGRGRSLVTAAHFFDQMGKKSVSEFIEFLERYAVRDVEPSGAVQVMTIHKAKGLGFDMVVLPDLKGQRLAQRRGGLGIHEGPRREVEWVLDLPPKEVRDHDPILSEHEAVSEAEACFERLCDLYVAMTRPKQALYMIAEAPGRSTSVNYTRLLQETLAGRDGNSRAFGEVEVPCVYESGDPEWHQEVTSGPSQGDRSRSGPAPPYEEEIPVRPRLVRRASSDETTGTVTANRLFSFERLSAVDFGTHVHAAFEQIEWADQETVDLLGRWIQEASAIPSEAQEAVLDEVKRCLAAPQVQAELACPSERAEVWREKSFEIVLNQEWITGVFDRVTLIRDLEGRYESAVIVDFKTDRIGKRGGAERLRQAYAPQLQLYRRVLSRLIELPERAIQCRLIATQAAQVIEIPPRE